MQLFFLPKKKTPGHVKHGIFRAEKQIYKKLHYTNTPVLRDMNQNTLDQNTPVHTTRETWHVQISQKNNHVKQSC